MPEADAGGKRRWAKYSDAKEHEGRTYHGMKVGGIHRWTYPDGEWTERKAQPDRWDITFTSLKRRKRKAPATSGAETGSGYHWLIVAHQWVEKLDANTYSTQMEGAKYLIAFKKPDWPAWNTQFRNAKRHARERTIAALEAEIARLKAMGDADAAFEDPHDAKALPRLAATWEGQEKKGKDGGAGAAGEARADAESSRGPRPRPGARARRARRQAAAR